MIKLKKYWRGHKAGSITDIIQPGIEQILVRRGYAEYLEEGFMDKFLDLEDKMISKPVKDKIVKKGKITKQKE